MNPINVFEYEALAQSKMDPAHWDYINGGNDDEVTLRSNRTSLKLVQRAESAGYRAIVLGISLEV